VLSRGNCHGHRRADNRGVQLEEYRDEIEEVVRQFGFHQEMATTAVRVFKRSHTLRLAAKKLRYMQLSPSTPSRLLIGGNALPLPFDPVILKHLTIFFHGGNLSNCDRAAFQLLRTSIPRINTYFPGLKSLRVEITWEIDEEQERWGPHHINLHMRGEMHAKALPLVDIRGAHKTCRDFIYLIWAMYEYCVRNQCEIELLSMDRSAIFNGNWEHDIEAAGYMFPNSNAWNPLGFLVWMSEYVTVHYELGDVNREREPIAVEYMPRAADLDPGVSEGYVAEALPTSIAWAAQHPIRVAKQKAFVAREKKKREAIA
jgi:hypothetical protein